MQFHSFFFDGTDITDLPGNIIHPRQALLMPGADDLLARIASASPGKISTMQLPAVEADAATHLIATGVLRSEGKRLYFDCPIILDGDRQTLASMTTRHAQRLADILMQHSAQLNAIVASKQDGFSPQRHLYHMLCGGVMDGAMFDHLEASGLVTTSKPLPTGANCLTILYEDTPALNQFSDLLLCSFNRLRTDSCTFVSFGDSDGLRRDFYRWFVCRSTNRPALQDTPLDALLPASLPELREEAGRQWLRLMAGHTLSDEWRTIFQHFGYTEQARPCVPVYTATEYETFQQQLDALVAPLLMPELRTVLAELATCNQLTAIRHGVASADLANEVYHILFGQINEQLVQCGLVAQPNHVLGEGRYLRCVEMENI
ncbi:MAG: hypothetical protein IJX84_10360 [Clostridia bacterium]|nr:hypothetical protein [Clostridia bacterium]